MQPAGVDAREFVLGVLAELQQLGSDRTTTQEQLVEVMNHLSTLQQMAEGQPGELMKPSAELHESIMLALEGRIGFLENQIQSALQNNDQVAAGKMQQLYDITQQHMQEQGALVVSTLRQHVDDACNNNAANMSGQLQQMKTELEQWSHNFSNLVVQRVSGVQSRAEERVQTLLTLVGDWRQDTEGKLVLLQSTVTDVEQRSQQMEERNQQCVLLVKSRLAVFEKALALVREDGAAQAQSVLDAFANSLSRVMDAVAASDRKLEQRLQENAKGYCDWITQLANQQDEKSKQLLETARAENRQELALKVAQEGVKQQLSMEQRLTHMQTAMTAVFDNVLQSMNELGHVSQKHAQAAAAVYAAQREADLKIARIEFDHLSKTHAAQALAKSVAHTTDTITRVHDATDERMSKQQEQLEVATLDVESVKVDVNVVKGEVGDLRNDVTQLRRDIKMAKVAEATAREQSHRQLAKQMERQLKEQAQAFDQQLKAQERAVAQQLQQLSETVLAAIHAHGKQSAGGKPSGTPAAKPQAAGTGAQRPTQSRGKQKTAASGKQQQRALLDGDDFTSDSSDSETESSTLSGDANDTSSGSDVSSTESDDALFPHLGRSMGKKRKITFSEEQDDDSDEEQHMRKIETRSTGFETSTRDAWKLHNWPWHKLGISKQHRHRAFAEFFEHMRDDLFKGAAGQWNGNQMVSVARRMCDDAFTWVHEHKLVSKHRPQYAPKHSDVEELVKHFWGACAQIQHVVDAAMMIAAFEVVYMKRHQQHQWPTQNDFLVVAAQLKKKHAQKRLKENLTGKSKTTAANSTQRRPASAGSSAASRDTSASRPPPKKSTPAIPLPASQQRLQQHGKQPASSQPAKKQLSASPSGNDEDSC